VKHRRDRRLAHADRAGETQNERTHERLVAHLSSRPRSSASYSAGGSAP
jgi:hypothetical protein